MDLLAFLAYLIIVGIPVALVSWAIAGLLDRLVLWGSLDEDSERW